MLNTVLEGMKEFFFGLFALLPFTVVIPPISPNFEPVIVEEVSIATSSADSTVSTTSALLPTAPIKMFSASPKPSPTSVTDIDLHLEKLTVRGGVHSCTSMSNETSVLLASALSVAPEEEIQRQKNEIREMRGCAVQEGVSLRIGNGNNSKIIATVRNNGHEEAKKVGVKVISDGEFWWSGDIESIPAGQSKTVEVPRGIGTSLGEHTFEFQVNPDKAFLETRFDNNSMRVKYVVD